MITRIRNTLAPLLPDALPVAGAGAGLAAGASLGVPPWLMAIAQAAIVVVWSARAVERKQDAISGRLEKLEHSIHGLACHDGTTCPTPPPHRRRKP